MIIFEYCSRDRFVDRGTKDFDERKEAMHHGLKYLDRFNAQYK